MEEESIRAALRNQVRRDVEKRVRARLGFFWHLAVFVVTNGAMLAINLLYSPAVLWFLWPLCAWSVGLGFHALATFQSTGGREAMVEAELERELTRRGLK